MVSLQCLTRRVYGIILYLLHTSHPSACVEKKVKYATTQ
jgi:hypothetical protein